MTLDPGSWLAIGGAVVSVVFWFARLEGKVQSQAREIGELRNGLTAAAAKADADANAAQAMRETLIRMDERLIHLTDLVEKLSNVRTRAKATP